MIDALNARLRAVPTWTLYIVAAVPPAWLFWLAASGGLGPDPANALQRELGKLALQMMVAVLAVTPLRRFAGVNLVRFRRAIGLIAFSYVILHFLGWIVLDMGLRIEQALGDIVKRPYIIVGATALLLLIPLAATSNNRAIRALGAMRWQRLHRLTYAVAVLGVTHYIMLVKGWPAEPFVYAALVGLLLALRLVPRRRLAAA